MPQPLQYLMSLSRVSVVPLSHGSFLLPLNPSVFCILELAKLRIFNLEFLSLHLLICRFLFLVESHPQSLGGCLSGALERICILFPREVGSQLPKLSFFFLAHLCLSCRLPVVLGLRMSSLIISFLFTLLYGQYSDPRREDPA